MKETTQRQLAAHDAFSPFSRLYHSKVAKGSDTFGASFEETSFSLESWTDSAFWLCWVSHLIWVQETLSVLAVFGLSSCQSGSD